MSLVQISSSLMSLHEDVTSKKICLIIPPSLFLLDDRVFMTIGILKVAAVLEDKGVTVHVLDLSGIKNFEDAMGDFITFHPDITIFGITATTPQMPPAAKIVSAIRKHCLKAKIIFGGPHITLINAAYKREKKNGIVGRAHNAMREAEHMFDVLVAGDGEVAIFHAIKDSSPQLIDADDKNSVMFMKNEDLNRLPFPARHLLEVGTYHYYIEGVRAFSMIAQLGCPFECGFCGGRSSDSLRKIRTRKPEIIIEEMVHIEETYDIKAFMMYDDELNVNRDFMHFLNLLEKTQKDRGTEWKLRGFIKAELFTQEQAYAMYRAGFRWILTGFESGSPKILQNINKKATREDNTRCVEFARRAGLKVKALMSIGHPGESRETIKETSDWLLEVKPDDFDVTIITTYPGTPYYDEAVPDPTKPGVWVYTYKNDKLYQIEIDYNKTADYYKGDPDGGYRAYVYTDYLSPEDLVSLRNELEKNIRHVLNIPFNPGAPGITYEHSMGQSGDIPSYIHRSTNKK